LWLFNQKKKWKRYRVRDCLKILKQVCNFRIGISRRNDDIENNKTADYLWIYVALVCAPCVCRKKNYTHTFVGKDFFSSWWTKVKAISAGHLNEREKKKKKKNFFFLIYSTIFFIQNVFFIFYFYFYFFVNERKWKI